MHTALPTPPAARVARTEDPAHRRPATARLARASRLPVAPGWKRRLDLGCILLSLPLVLPVMALTAGWIRLRAGGPLLLRQQRIGRHGKPFALYKFRSIVVNADTQRHESYVRHLVASDQPMIKLDMLGDSRLIAGGRLLRAAGLDELPQLWNVVRGEMSLVGPRPCLPGEYGFFSPRQRERFEALPGLTGIWQVLGKNRASFSEMIVMDIHYVRHASLRMDLSILLRTPAALLCQMRLAWRSRRAARPRCSYQGSDRDAHAAGAPQRHSPSQ